MESELDRDMDHLDILDRENDGRCQTLKDFCRRIKQLEGENFQLRLRIYMNEQKLNGASANTFDPFSKNELANEYTMMKKQRDEAEQKLRDLQNNSTFVSSKPTSATNGGDNNNHHKIETRNINEMTRALVDLGTKYNHLEADNKFLHLQLQESQSNVKSLKLEVDRLTELYECKVHELHEEQSKNTNLVMQLEKTQEQRDRSLADINIMRREGEKQMSVRQDHIHNRQISQLLAGNQDLRCKLGISEEALKVLYQEHIKLVAELRHLKANYNAQVHALNQQNEVPIAAVMGRGDRHNPVRHNLSSPDLGIGLESGQEAPSNENNDDDEISMLRRQKSHLVYKLQQTRQALDKTATRLSSTTKHKEQVERAVCRQLHKTHSILKEAKQSLEKKQSQQTLTDLLPSSV